MGQNKVAVVTGASKGIGLAITQWFLARDWSVAVLDNDKVALADSKAQAYANVLDRVLIQECDVGEPSQVQAALEAVNARFGRADALVNNAGVAVFDRVQDTSFDAWRWVMRTNLDGVFLCSQTFIPLLAAGGGGAIVNIASISGLRASSMRVAYGTSKAAVIHLTKQQAMELGELKIRVNAVAPGPVETAMAKLVHTQAIRTDYANAIPLGRYGTPEEIANAVGFLCSDEASFITGQTLAADGGFDAAGIGLPTLRAGGR